MNTFPNTFPGTYNPFGFSTPFNTPWTGSPWGQYGWNTPSSFGGLPFGGFNSPFNFNNFSNSLFNGFSGGSLPWGGFSGLTGLNGWSNPINTIPSQNWFPGFTGSPFGGFLGNNTLPFGLNGLNGLYGLNGLGNTLGYNGLGGLGLNSGFPFGLNAGWTSTPWGANLPGYGLGSIPFGQYGLSANTPWNTNTPNFSNQTIPGNGSQNFSNAQGSNVGPFGAQPFGGSNIPFNTIYPYAFNPFIGGAPAPFFGQPWGYNPGYAPINGGFHPQTGSPIATVPFQQGNPAVQQGLCRDAA